MTDEGARKRKLGRPRPTKTREKRDGENPRGQLAVRESSWSGV